ncbi:hypothetical protein J6590_029765 [Homalodisca vitripennis]|nr:hypothetical protein J6590_029765 [Homalodisca vitripennis]
MKINGMRSTETVKLWLKWTATSHFLVSDVGGRRGRRWWPLGWNGERPWGDLELMRTGLRLTDVDLKLGTNLPSHHDTSLRQKLSGEKTLLVLVTCPESHSLKVCQATGACLWPRTREHAVAHICDSRCPARARPCQPRLSTGSLEDCYSPRTIEPQVRVFDPGRVSKR